MQDNPTWDPKMQEFQLSWAFQLSDSLYSLNKDYHNNDIP